MYIIYIIFIYNLSLDNGCVAFAQTENSWKWHSWPTPAHRGPLKEAGTPIAQLPQTEDHKAQPQLLIKLVPHSGWGVSSAPDLLIPSSCRAAQPPPTHSIPKAGWNSSLSFLVCLYQSCLHPYPLESRSQRALIPVPPPFQHVSVGWNSGLGCLVCCGRVPAPAGYVPAQSRAGQESKRMIKFGFIGTWLLA